MAKGYTTTIDVISYRDVWHLAQKADHLCWIFGIRTSDCVRIVEEPHSVSFTFRPTFNWPSFVDSGKPSAGIVGSSVLFAVVPSNR